MTGLYAGDGSTPGPDDVDPVRQSNARILYQLAVTWELNEQLFESFEAKFIDLTGRVEALAATVAMLETLITGQTP